MLSESWLAGAKRYRGSEGLGTNHKIERMSAQMIEGFALSLQQKSSWSFRASVREGQLVSQAEYVIRGKLQTNVFEQALRRVVERHEILRSVFKSVPGLAEPVQIVESEFEVPVAKRSPGSRRLESAARLDFDLESRSPEEHVLRISLPPICADYRSLRLIMEELAAGYERAQGGQRTMDEPMQYVDYAQWQADLQTSSEAGAGLQFWRNLELGKSGAKIALERMGNSFRHERESRVIDYELWAQLERAAGARGVSSDMVMAAAWIAFCSRLQEGQSEVIVRIETPGRSFEELQKAIGPYDRYLPLRVNVKDHDSGATILNALASTHKSARHYQEFYKGQSDGEFGVLFANREIGRPVTAAGLQFGFRKGESHNEPFKLKLELVQSQSAAPSLEMYYDVSRFTSEYAQVLADRFQVFLGAFLQNMDAPVRTLENASPAELQVATRNFARGEPAELGQPTVLHRFKEEVDEHPQRPALICGGQILSYAQLDERANRLANLLVKLGIAPGEPVAICAERSFEMIVGLVGIQKAGGAYVPLDPTYPKERLQFVLEDCGAKVLVAQPALLAKLPAHKGTTVELSEQNGQLNAEESAEPGATINPENAAYIIYTSGSTGQPKGVPITHRNLAFSTAARLRYYKEPIANYLLLSSFAFDSSIAGIFWTLVQGATLTMPREGTHNDPKALASLISEYKVSHVLALPSFYQAIINNAAEEELRSLTTVIVAGEACVPELVERHYRKLSQAQLYNEYGPTEGTVWATVHKCERDSGERTVPIGRPVANMSVYILNEQSEPVGIGQLGEICIGGPSVAKGYLNRPELSAQKFVANPLAHRGEAGTPSTLYRTGDLACFRSDGTIEFHGRIDEQVKIRGYRIEIGEIENVLTRHPEVRDAVVLAREDAPGEKRLVAYVVSKHQAHFSIPDLRIFAQEKLPQFMVPTQFVVLGALPLTPNGKVDRKALPAPEELNRKERKLVSPRNPDEAQLARIWREVLKLDTVGMEENFFELGGHSLLAIQVIARVRDAFSLELPMASIFEAPTIEGMAAALARCRQGKRTAPGGIRRIARVRPNGEMLTQTRAEAAK